VVSACPGSTVCERVAPAGCVDPEWAEWLMPNDTNEVAHAAPNLQTLVDNLDGTVTDRVTGLMWEQAFHSSEFADDTVCPTSVSTGGYTDWRMPTIIELISLADFSKSQPFFDTAVFPLANVGPFWSRTVREGFGSAHYIIDYEAPSGPLIFASGGIGVDGILGLNIRCVR
jgi:hypothetical protein